MKTLCLLFAIVFLVFKIQATPALSSQNEVKATRAPEPSDYREDDHGLKKNSALSSRLTTFACFGPFGYCLPRNWQCLSERVFLEEFNDCPVPDVFKCCLL
ncbi:hypothetical protein JD844_025727 [Phrynosoma platyrhinos]|uniref:Uncharacterized protein n=1 Tax=Phrynosoma platyrhinos TaxID=52577 RepID=A0ABQ7T055_PHRPL|nr:hypothetical protein JD844_025727 [Phrynosoma platyrhinos]